MAFIASCRRRQWQPTPVLLPGKSHGWSLVGCSPWGHEEWDMTEWLHFHFSLSYIGEGNGNPLQYSCLENPMDGAWWAAIYGVAQSRTRLKGLSSNSSIASCNIDQVETCAVYPTSLGTSLVLNCTGSCLVCQPSVGCILRRSIVSWWQQSGISSSRLFRLLG